MWAPEWLCTQDTQPMTEKGLRLTVLLCGKDSARKVPLWIPQAGKMMLTKQGFPILLFLCVNGKWLDITQGCLSEVTGTFKEKTHDSMLFNHALLNLWVCPVHLSCREGQNSWILLPLCSYKSPLSFQFLSVWPMLWSDRKWACLYLKSKAARRFSQSKFLKAKTWFQIQEKYVIKKNAS